MGAQQPSEKSTRDSQDFCFQTLLLRQFDFYSWKEISAASNCLFESRSHRSNRKLTGGLWLVEIYIKCTYIYIYTYIFTNLYFYLYLHTISIYIYINTHTHNIEARGTTEKYVFQAKCSLPNLTFSGPNKMPKTYSL